LHILFYEQLTDLSKLKRAQNLLARVVTGSFQSSSHNLLQRLHWLPIEHRIHFKISNITFHILFSSQPAYLLSALHARHSTCSLRLSDTNLLFIPYVSTLAPIVSVLQLLQSGILSLQPSEYVSAVIHFAITLRPIISSRPSNPLITLRLTFSFG